MGRGTDRFFQEIFGMIRRTIGYVNRQTFIALANWLAIHVLFRIRRLYVDIKHEFISHPQGKKLIDAVRGRAEVKDHGASFYLRRIGDK